MSGSQRGFVRFWTSVLLMWMAVPAVADGPDRFQMALWPGPGGLMEASGAEEAAAGLESAWYAALMPTWLNRPPQIHAPANGSLERYLQTVEAYRPECIEGEAGFVERAAVRGGRMDYYPVLECAGEPLGAEIVFRQGAGPWTGTLGVVHPDYTPGGRAQIDHWRAAAGSEPAWVAYHSVREVLSHLFVGSIEAAAVPAGSLGAFLRERNRESLAPGLTRIVVPGAESRVGVYLRGDLYEKPLYRALVSETWLRGQFPSRFAPVPRTWPRAPRPE